MNSFFCQLFKKKDMIISYEKKLLHTFYVNAQCIS